MRPRLVAIGFVIVVLAAGTVTLRATRRSAGAPTTEVVKQQDPVSVTTAAVHRANFVTSVSAVGAVASLREARIGTKTSGRVATVLVQEGQRVPAGAPLMQLDTSELVAQESQARANVEMARARLEQLQAGARVEERRQTANAAAQAQWTLRLAQAEVQRLRTLYEQGAVSKQQLEVAETQLAQAQMADDSAQQSVKLVQLGPRPEEIQVARAQLAQAEANLAAARIRLQDATVVAPFAGTIVQRMVEPGETVSSVSPPSFLLAQLDEVFVELAVPERHRAALRPGQPVTIAVDALPGSLFKGKVEEIRPAAVTASRSFTVKVRVPNPQGTLRPGMFARGTIEVAVRPLVLQIPERAVLMTATRPVVFVVQNGQAIRREVSPGDRQGGLVEITTGLNEGEQVIVEGHEGLRDNQPVAPRSPQQ